MYATLQAPHARDTVRGAELEDALRKLGAWVLDNSYEELLGATTLHGHFPVAEGEALLDRVNVGARRIKTQVVPVTEVTREQETTWGFTPDGSQVALGWSDDAHADPQLLAAVKAAGVLLAHEELTTVLAVMALGEPFPMADEVLYEQTDEAGREQITTPVRRRDVPAEQAAAWRFELIDPAQKRGTVKPEHVRLVMVQGCDPGCGPRS